MASWDDLLPHIPEIAWGWLKKGSVLHPDSPIFKCEVSPDAFEQVQRLGDVELTASYLFIVWSENSWLHPEACAAMLGFIRRELRGVQGAQSRAVLIQRLNDVLSRLVATSREGARKRAQYQGFGEVLVEVEEEAMVEVKEVAETRTSLPRQALSTGQHREAGSDERVIAPVPHTYLA